MIPQQAYRVAPLLLVAALSAMSSARAQELHGDTCLVAPTPAVEAPYGYVVHARVNSKNPDAHTGIILAQGSAYRIEAHGSVTDGKRLKPTTPAGYGPLEGGLGWNLLFEFMRFVAQHRTRYPGATWFALVGYAQEKPDSFVEIGERLERWIPAGSGELIVFLNDVSGHYENNVGCVDIFVTRIP